MADHPALMFDSLTSKIRHSAVRLEDAKQQRNQAIQAFRAWLRDNPPTSFRLQEAYKNPDGTMSEPHWDEVLDYATHNAIDQEEVFWALTDSDWYEVFHNPEDDPRPGYRRIVDVTWE